MLWNGGMIGLGFAPLDGSILMPALAWLAIGCVLAWIVEESSGLWRALED